jgi:hypothetical protein
MSGDRSSPCDPTATTRTTGRCTSTPTRRFARRSARRGILRPRRTCTCVSMRPRVSLLRTPKKGRRRGGRLSELLKEAEGNRPSMPLSRATIEGMRARRRSAFGCDVSAMWLPSSEVWRPGPHLGCLRRFRTILGRVGRRSAPGGRARGPAGGSRRTTDHRRVPTIQRIAFASIV